jgi:hypothetical protein
MPRKRNRKLQHSKTPPECLGGLVLRRCLRCAGWFCSEGSGNRQCHKCFDDSVHISRRQQSPGTVISGDEGGAEDY